MITLAPLPRRDGRDRVLVERLELLPLPLPRRRRHRRRVLGDQLRDRRADPGARARLGRPRDQRLVVARHRRRRAALDSSSSNPSIFPIDLGWRLDVRARRDPRHRRPDHAAAAAREPALADDQGRERRGRADRRGDRAAGRREQTGEQLDDARRNDRDRAARVDAGSSTIGADDVLAIHGPYRARADDDERAGVRLQRRLLHVRPRARRRSARATCAHVGYYIVPFAIGQLPRADPARPACSTVSGAGSC